MSEYPEDLTYTPDHEWVLAGNDDVVRVGVTAYAVEALSDIVFAALPTPGQEVEAGDAVAELESTKSVSEVFSPVSGVIARVNDLVTDRPELINEDPYGSGWLFEVELSDPAELEDLLDVTAYTEHLDD